MGPARCGYTALVSPPESLSTASATRDDSSEQYGKVTAASHGVVSRGRGSTPWEPRSAAAPALRRGCLLHLACFVCTESPPGLPVRRGQQVRGGPRVRVPGKPPTVRTSHHTTRGLARLGPAVSPIRPRGLVAHKIIRQGGAPRFLRLVAGLSVLWPHRLGVGIYQLILAVSLGPGVSCCALI